MDKVTKKYLLNLIESIQSDVDEMALRQKGTRTDKEPKGDFAPIFGPSNPTPPGEYGEPDGYYIPSINQVVVILGCQELEQFTQANRDLLDGLAEKYHNKYGTSTDEMVKEILYAPCKRTDYPSSELKKFLKTKNWVEPEKTERETTPESMNKTQLGKLLRENLFGENMSETLRKKSIPFLPLRKGSMDTLFQGLRGYGDQHSPEFSDQKISFRLFAGSLYESQIDFLNSIILNYEGDFSSANQRNLKLTRQFNKIYSNYDAGRKMAKKFEGLTPKQQKAVRDYEEANIDATVRMDMNIVGELIGENSFTWDIELSVKLGKKLEDDERLKEGFKTLENIRVRENVQLNPNESKSPIMKNKNVANGFVKVCNDLRNRIDAIEFEKLLEYANIETSGELDFGYELQEMVDRIVKKIVK